MWGSTMIVHVIKNIKKTILLHFLTNAHKIKGRSLDIKTEAKTQVQPDYLILISSPLESTFSKRDQRDFSRSGTYDRPRI